MLYKMIYSKYPFQYPESSECHFKALLSRERHC